MFRRHRLQILLNKRYKFSNGRLYASAVLRVILGHVPINDIAFHEWMWRYDKNIIGLWQSFCQ